jgi:hypothetical protein
MSMSERQILTFDPFQGDYPGAGDGDRLLSDKMVTCRKARPCHTCAELTVTGSRIRARVEVYDGEMMSFAWCAECCATMAKDDDGEAYEKRIELGAENRDD